MVSAAACIMDLNKLPDELKILVIQTKMRMFPTFEASARCVSRTFRDLPSMGFPFYRAGSGERFAIETMRGLENAHMSVPEDLKWKGRSLEDILEAIQRTLVDCKAGEDTDWHDYENYRAETSLYFEPTRRMWVCHVVFVNDEFERQEDQAPLPAQYACLFWYMRGLFEGALDFRTIGEDGRRISAWMDSNQPILLKRRVYRVVPI